MVKGCVLIVHFALADTLTWPLDLFQLCRSLMFLNAFLGNNNFSA